jgi:hypothetical protein
MFGVKDKNGNRWAFSNGGYWGSDTLANRIEGDSIDINFSISNIAFYIEDGVPYEAYEYIGHKGVKIH